MGAESRAWSELCGVRIKVVGELVRPVGVGAVTRSIDDFDFDSVGIFEIQSIISVVSTGATFDDRGALSDQEIHPSHSSKTGRPREVS